MKPGRELDALVAEKVMGWKRMTYAQIYAGRDPNTHGYANEHRLTGYWHHPWEMHPIFKTNREMARAEDCDDYYAPERAWSPSTDIAAAWEVFDKVRKDFCEAWVGRSDTEVTAHWECTFQDPEWSVKATDRDSAPMAICLAALRTVGVEVEV